MSPTIRTSASPRAPRLVASAKPGNPSSERLKVGLLVATAVFLSACLIYLAVLSPMLGFVGIGFSMMIAALAFFGMEKVGFTMMAAAFATAPMYKGLALTHGAQITPTDLLIVFGFMAMVGRVLRGHVNAPLDYRVTAILLFIFGCFGTVVSDSPANSLLSLILWVAAFAMLPIGMAALGMTQREVKILAWAYVAGQVFDTLYAAGHDHGRWMGLSGHPNNFAEYAVYAMCLLTWLHQVTDRKHHWILWIVALTQLGATFESGSRAATLALAALVLIYPFVERSTKAAVGIAAVGAIALCVLGFMLEHASSDSALGRLTGAGNAAGSDQARTQGLHTGWQSFMEHPFSGSGLTFQNLFEVHNGFLEVAVATGVVGFFAYVGLLISFDRAVLLKSPMSRLGYAAIAFTIIGSFEPSLWDRGTWCAVAFGFLAHQSVKQTDVIGSDPTAVPHGRQMRGTPA